MRPKSKFIIFKTKRVSAKKIQLAKSKIDLLVNAPTNPYHKITNNIIKIS